MEPANEPIRTKIKQFIAKQFPSAKHHDLRDNESLIGTGILDSLGILDLVVFLEQEFRVAIGDDELVPENFETIQSLTSFVLNKISR